MCPYFCKNLSVVMYRKFRNVPIFRDFPSICPYFLGFRVGKYVNVQMNVLSKGNSREFHWISVFEIIYLHGWNSMGP